MMMQSKLQEDKENNMNNITNHSVLNAFDFTAIDEMDPSLCKDQTFFLDPSFYS